MKRRDALKKIGLAAGFTAITPNIFGLLQSCTNDSESWTPSFLTSDEKSVVTNIVDVFLPRTVNTPSASEVNVAQFIDKYIHEILEDKDQELTRAGFKKVIAILIPDSSSRIEDIKAEEYKNLLDEHLLLEEIDNDQEVDPEILEMTSSEFLNQLKWMTINAYKNSKFVGENVLAYDPIPMDYYCGNLEEITGGKSWSL
ncbi:MAG: Uncharacterised protein [Flavobacterium sp. SCGC AAA160-P02]|nr:MAG: Uncharacterised protein [Flavobacterium sp. SCGC AAA160-P02]